MDALKAVGLNPLPVLAKQTEPKKNLSYSTVSPFKNQSFSNPSTSNCGLSASRTVSGGLVLLSSFLSSGLATALTLDEALQQPLSSSSSISDFDVSGILDSAIRFAAENPIIAGGGAAVVAVPLVVAQLLGKAKPWGVESAKVAYAKLGDDASAQLLDIRSTAEIKQSGSPDIRGLKKKAVAVVYNGDDKPGFLKKLSLKLKEPQNTTLFILDKFDGNSEIVAELVTSNGFKAAYAIKDGAEGSRGWVNSSLPWKLPTTTLDLSSFTDAIGDAFGEASDGVPLALGVAAAAAGLGLLAFAEAETILQVLGSAALVQFVSKKLLFAEDRKQTIKQFEELLNTKVAPKELVDDIQQIGKAILPPLPVNNKGLPAPAEETTTPPPSEQPAVLKPEPTTEATGAPPEVEATPEVVNSVPKPEVKEESLPKLARPLSPYANYPDYKPPSSPTPSPP